MMEGEMEAGYMTACLSTIIAVCTIWNSRAQSKISKKINKDSLSNQEKINKDNLSHQREMADKENQQKLAMEREKYKNDRLKKFDENMIELLSKSHKLISRICREFSKINFVTMASASMSQQDFNAKYIKICEDCDEVMMILGFYAPSLVEDFQEIDGEMKKVWEYFGTYLYNKSKKNSSSDGQEFLNEAGKASEKIQKISIELKKNLQNFYILQCYPK